MEDFFSMFFPRFIGFKLLFCDYERKVWIELIVYVCYWKQWIDYYAKNVD